MSSNSKIMMSENSLQKVFYKSAVISKVYDDDTYNIRLSTGRLRTYVENTSGMKFNSGDFVAVLLSEDVGSEICKIIGKGRRIETAGTIPIIRV